MTLEDYDGFRQRIITEKIKPDLNVNKSDMNETMVYDIQRITINAIKESEKISEMTAQIRSDMNRNYPDWAGFHYNIIYVRSYLNNPFSPKTPTA
ncbi:unnamed protein product [Oppiella nova]|uniref:Uncharacterized protein n=1 Tax=Oppiella nova TaxID=334625 RepID=A0A7R9QGJ8_9ACAR|nr:unnamed protein product [Oppiella nova]CAG2165493.1 unnamed protein product [Oppiella nova]